MNPTAPKGGAAKGPSPTSAERKRSAELLGRIRPSDPESVLEFGTNVQTQVSRFQHRVMAQVQAKDHARVIDLLDRMLGRLKALDMGPGGRPSLARKLRAWRGRLSWTEQCVADYQELEQEFERHGDELAEARGRLLSEVGIFERLYEQNLELLRDVTRHVRALDARISQLRKTLPRLEKKHEASDDPLIGLELQDATDQIERLERRARDLSLTGEICVQNARQIRLSQHDRQMLAERTVDSVLNAIPLWKTQISIALVQSRQKQTLRLHKRIMQATDDVLGRNRSVLDEGRDEASSTARSLLAAERLGPVPVKPKGRPAPVSTGTEGRDH